LTKPKSGFAALYLSNKIVIIGGNDGHVLNRVEALDLVSLKWGQLPSMLTRRDELAATIGPDGKIYAVGGYGGPDK
jgi:hypothetical protein